MSQIGFLIGFILIFLGMSAVLYIGCLITPFHLNAKDASASALIVTLPALIIGTLTNYKDQIINYRHGNKLLGWALIGTLGGSLLVPLANHFVYQLIICLILTVLAISILINSFIRNIIIH